MKNYPGISQNRLKNYSKLLQKKYRQSERRFLVEGMNIVQEAINSDWDVESIVFCLDSDVNEKQIKNLEKRKSGKKVEVMAASPKDFEKLSDTVTSQGIIAVVRMKNILLESILEKPSKHSIIVALDNVTDPGNVGTIIRTCDWFGVDGVLLGEGTVELYNPKVVRSTMGGIFHIPLVTDVNLVSSIHDLRKKNFKVITTVLKGGTLLNKFSFKDRNFIILGNEAHGVSAEIEKLSDETITIPKFGLSESLNVAIACGIILNTAKTFNL